MPYPLPSWLNQPTDTAGEFTRGLSLGATIAQESNRLQMQAQAQEMEAAVTAERLKRESLRQQQELEMRKAYQQAMVGLRQSQLENAAKVTALKTTQAAQRFAAQKKYQDLVAGGMDAAQAALQLGPELGLSMGGMGSLARAVKPAPSVAEPTVRTFGKSGAEFLEVPHPGGWKQYMPIRDEAAMSNAERGQILRELNTEEKGITENYAGDITKYKPKNKASEDQWNADKRRLREIKEQKQELLPALRGGNVPRGTKGEVVRTTKEGRKAVFDAETKKFLRYAD